MSMSAARKKKRESEWDQLKALMMPTGFGSTDKSDKSDKSKPKEPKDPKPNQNPAPLPAQQDQDQDQDQDHDPPSSPDTVGPMPLHPSMDLDPSSRTSQSGSDSDDDDDLTDAHADLATLPLSHSFLLPAPTASALGAHPGGPAKPVLCVSCDPSGTRLATGSADHVLRLWDFAGLSSASPLPFKSIDSEAAPQPIVDVHWSPSGDALLVTRAGACQPHVYSRDGARVAELAKGDMYLRDVRRTEGHTAPVVAVAWDPLTKGRCATGAMDGTVRIWDTAKPKKSLAVIVFNRQAAGAAARAGVSAVAYARNGTWIAAGAADGAVRVWKLSAASFNSPACDIAPLPEGAPAVVALEFASDPRVLLARYDDGSLARWDLAPPSAGAPIDKLVAKLATPAARSPGLPLHAVLGGNLAFSPSDRFVLVGGLDPQAGDPRSAPGRLLVLDARTLYPVTHVDLDAAVGGAGRVHWAARTNQVFVATASGTCVVMYSDEHSEKGVKLCLGRTPSHKTHWVDHELEQVLLDRAGAQLEVAAQRMAKAKGKGRGSALVQVHGGKISKRQLAALRGDAVPAARVAARGKLADSASQGGGAIFFAQADAHARPPLDRDVDPREAILKYAEAAAKDPYWITPAYKATQPEAVLADKVVEEDEEARVIVEKSKEDRQKVLRRRDF